MYIYKLIILSIHILIINNIYCQNKIIIPVDSIYVNNEIIIGNISYLDISKNYNLLITDRLSQKVILIDGNGNLLNVLNPEKCTPGINWRPIYAKFNKKNKIYVINSIPWGYRFDKFGKCIGGMDISFISPLHLEFKNNGNLVGYYVLEDGNCLKEMDNYGRVKKKFGVFPKKYRNIIYRIEGGGLVIDKNDNIFQANVNEPVIYKMDVNNTMTKIKKKNSYNIIDNDISHTSDLRTIMSEIKNTIENKVITESLFLLDSNRVALQLRYRKKYIIQIYDTMGNFVINEDIQIQYPFITAKYGYFYRIYQPEPNVSSKKLPNPVIIKYRISNIE